ncbi:cytochrome P450 [Favolaschia claudopus]|uniref:Cytochrome P450 n=1 Tax=Favolaschia claudopus TaxID=2862362 RepID=A0AAW0E936_9AGAR
MAFIGIPGIVYSFKLLPGFLAPPITVYFLKWLAETHLNIIQLQVSPWVFGPLCLFSYPLVFTARVQYQLWKDRRAARVRGAVIPPVVPASIGGIDKVIAGLRTGRNQYPAENLAILAKSLGTIFDLRILFENRFFTCEPEHLKIILATEFNHFEKGEDTRVIFEPLLGSGIFSADGDLWKFHRAMTRPFFKRDRISDFELFDRHSLEAISVLKDRLREGYPVDFQDLVSRFALDSSSEFLWGRNPHTLGSGLPFPPRSSAALRANATSATNKSNAFAAALNESQDVTMQRGALGAAWPLAEFWHDMLAKPLRVVYDFLDPILSETMARQNARPAEGKGVDVKQQVADREVQEGETLVEHLLHYVQDRNMLRDEILNISTAGRDTTACLLTFVVYMLTGHPKVLAKLREEILNTVGQTRAPTPDDFRDMKYLRAVLNETLRLYAPVPVNMRSTTAPVLMPSMTGGAPHYIPAKSKVIYSVLVMHRREDLWGPDALEWDPERFIDERLHKYLTPNPFIFLPFNAGPRICLGQQFAYHEASFFLVRLLQHVSDISLAPEAQPVPYIPRDPKDDPLGWKKNERATIRSHLTMYVEGGLWVTMKEAENTATA